MPPALDPSAVQFSLGSDLSADAEKRIKALADVSRRCFSFSPVARPPALTAEQLCASLGLRVPVHGRCLALPCRWRSCACCLRCSHHSLTQVAVSDHYCFLFSFVRSMQTVVDDITKRYSMGDELGRCALSPSYSWQQQRAQARGGARAPNTGTGTGTGTGTALALVMVVLQPASGSSSESCQEEKGRRS